MEMENIITEYKSLQKITKGDSGLADLAKTCVCLANSQGGIIYIGFDDKTRVPPVNQKIAQDQINNTITRLRSLCFNTAITSSEIHKHNNGGQFFILNVIPSTKSIATTSDGKIYIRIGDECHPVRSEDISHLVAEKDSFQWELVTSKNIKIPDINPSEINSFVSEIRASVKTTENIKNKTDIEVLEYYNFIDGEYLTNLGILWLGYPRQRTRISYPITVQYIVYDKNDVKVRKEVWHDYALNPRDLILDIERKAVELTYFHELPKRMFRDQIRHYPEKVVRELLVNAFAHKSYTISGDIFIEVYENRIEITNPGGLPTGVTKHNILHQRRRRNPHLINVLHDLNLMEGEGSGYDMIYEVNSRFGKPFPEIVSEYDSTKVIQESKLVDENSLHLLSHISEHFILKQKEMIALGVIVRERKILSSQLSKELQLAGDDRLRTWVSGLTGQGIIISRGLKKGTEYLINPKLIASAESNIKPSLITIEPYRLQAMIEEDLLMHPESLIADIEKRLVDVPLKDLRKSIYTMVKSGVLNFFGGKTYRKYSLAKKNRNEKESKKEI
jgi:ATP-dependent DNA helicase RecG